MKKLLILLLLFYATFNMGCASAPELDAYPQRQIDRPYTLPNNLASWTTTASLGLIDEKSSDSSFFIFPLLWQQALSDNWTLEYTPLPLSVRYQVSKTEKNIVGLRFGSGFGYSSNQGFIFQPLLGVYHRYRLSPSRALESTFQYTKYFSGKKNKDSFESAQASTGPMFQIDSNKVITPKLGLSLVKNGFANHENLSNFVGDDDFSLYIPASVQFKWLFHRQWELSTGYAINSLVLDDDEFAIHELSTSMRFYW